MGKVINCAYCGEALTSFFPNKANKCRFCGSINYINEKVDLSSRFSQAQNRLTTYRFSKADEIYFDIYNEASDVSSKAMSLWGRILAFFGVVYIRSSVQEEYVVTFSNYHPEVKSVKELDLVEELLSLDLSKSEKEEYEKKIDQLDKEYVQIEHQLNEKQEYDVFICVKISKALAANNYEKGFSQDSKVAEALYQELTSQGMRVFYSAKSLGGVDSDSQILSALIKSKNIIVISSSLEYLESPWVQSEWRRWINFIDVGSKDKDSFFLYVMNNIELPYVLKEKRAQIISSYPTLMELLKERINPKSLQDQKIIQDIEEEIEVLSDAFNRKEISFKWCDDLEKVGAKVKALGTDASSIINYNDFDEMHSKARIIRRDLSIDKEIEKLKNSKNHSSIFWANKVLKLDKRLRKINCEYSLLFENFPPLLEEAKKKISLVRTYRIVKVVSIILLSIASFVGVGIAGVNYIVFPIVTKNIFMNYLESGDYTNAYNYAKQYIDSGKINAKDYGELLDVCQAGKLLEENSYSEGIEKLIEMDYKVTINLDEGEGATLINVDNVSLKKEKKSENITSGNIHYVAEKNYYDFIGWAVSDVKIDYLENKTAEISLKAEFTPKVYKIEYDLSGSEVTFPEGQITSYVYGQETSITTPIREGYTFIGWAKENEETVVKNYVISNTDNGDIKLVANWKANTYTISYNDSTSSNIKSTSVTFGEPIPKLETYKSEEGEEFLYWYYSDNGNEIKIVEGEEYIYPKDIIVHAKTDYTKYKVTYYDADGNVLEVEDKYSSFTISSNYEFYSGYEKDGYNLNGWKVRGTNQIFSVYDDITDLYTIEDLELDPIITAKSLTLEFFDKNNQSGLHIYYKKIDYDQEYSISEDSIKKIGYTIQSITFNGKDFPLTGVANYENIGKYDDLENEIVIILVEYEPIEYTLTYYIDDEIYNSRTFTCEDYFDLEDIQIEGCTLLGWYKDKEFKERISYINSGTIGDVNVYGKVESTDYYIYFEDNKTYTITYSKNSYYEGGTFTKKTGETLYKIVPESTRSYHFIGWYYDKACTIPFKWDKVCTDLVLFSKWINNSNTNFVITKSVDVGVKSSTSGSSINLYAIEDGLYKVQFKNGTLGKESSIGIRVKGEKDFLAKFEDYSANSYIEVYLKQGIQYEIVVFAPLDNQVDTVILNASLIRGDYPNEIKVGFNDIVVNYNQEIDISYNDPYYSIDKFYLEDGSEFDGIVNGKFVGLKNYYVTSYDIVKKKTPINWVYGGTTSNDIIPFTNGEALLPSETPQYFDVDGLDSLPTPSWEGYTFSGWRWNNRVGDRAEEIPSFYVADKVTLFAYFEGNNYTYTLDYGYEDLIKVYYDLKDGNGPILLDNNDLKLPVNPTKEGYIFDGWSAVTTSGRVDKISSPYVIEEDTVFVCRWLDKSVIEDYELIGDYVYSVNLENEALINTFGVSNLKGFASSTCKYKFVLDSFETSEKLSNNQVACYVYFFYQNRVVSELNVVYNNGEYELITKSHINQLYGMGSVDSVSIFNGSCNSGTLKFHFDSDNNLNTTIDLFTTSVHIYQGDSIKTLSNPTQNGYTFDGWYYGDTKVEKGDVYNYASNVTFVARWTKEDNLSSYQCTYYYVDSETKQVLKVYEVLKNNDQDYNFASHDPYLPGYRISSINGGNAYLDKDLTNPYSSIVVEKGNTENKVVYLSCERNSYTVSFTSPSDIELQDITSIEDMTFKYEEEITSLPILSSPNPDYTFVGWKCENDYFYTDSDKRMYYCNDMNSTFEAIWIKTSEKTLFDSIKNLDTYTFGMFPQTEITSSNSNYKNIVTLAGTYSSSNTNWKRVNEDYITSYEVLYTYAYSFTYDGNNYCALYRDHGSSTDYSYFKYEPVIWDVVLSTNEGKASISLISQKILLFGNSHNGYSIVSNTDFYNFKIDFFNNLFIYDTFETLDISFSLPSYSLLISDNNKYKNAESRIKSLTEFAFKVYGSKEEFTMKNGTYALSERFTFVNSQGKYITANNGGYTLHSASNSALEGIAICLTLSYNLYIDK